MGWFKMDDQFGVSQKVIRIPRKKRKTIIGLWTLAGNYAARALTDGVLEAHELDELDASAAEVAELVRVGLWHSSGHACGRCVPVGDRAVVIHDFLEYNPSREQILAAREAERVRKASYRKSKQRPSGTDEGTPGGSDPESEHPDPTRPVNATTPDGVVARTRGTRIPEPFVVTGQMRVWAASEVPAVDVDAATRKFVDHWRAKSSRYGTKRDWTAAWRNWLRTDAERKPQARPDKDERALSVIEMGQRMAAAADAGARREVTA